MACPTCDHTMQCYGRTSQGERVFYCPRCGTMKLGDEEREITRPRLVNYVRAFLADVQGAGVSIDLDALNKLAHRHGVLESIDITAKGNQG